ncbi:MAG TPA: hypothetical protein VEY92_08390 [Pseudoxanthomonas sp.]|nr:hypothetical protein [Pseudoxanthomonas sp.]
MKHAAKLPFALIEKYLADHPGVTMQDMMRANSPHIREMLNDPALSGFRIWRGKV